MQECVFEVDHSTVNRWVVRYTPLLEKAFHQKKKRPGCRWRMDEMYIKVKGQWRYYYRAVDKENNTIDFLLTAKHDKKAALRFLNKAIGRNGKPNLINMDKSGANKAGIKSYNFENHRRIEIRQCEYLNNIIEQDHSFIKRKTKLVLGFKNFDAAQNTLAGVELVRMLKKGQLRKTRGDVLSPRTVLCVGSVSW